MKQLILIIALVPLFFSCTDKEDEILLENLSIENYKALELKLVSKTIQYSDKDQLPNAFLPIDTILNLRNAIGFRRTDFVSLPMYSRAYSDSLGNCAYVYEWDKVTPEMDQNERDQIKREFEKYHAEYVAKYNHLTNYITAVLGAPSTVDKKLEASDMEVYKFWKSSQIWKKDNQTVELNLILMPNELYRVIVKILVLKKKA
jgi:hypothetical protein